MSMKTFPTTIIPLLDSPEPPETEKAIDSDFGNGAVWTAELSRFPVRSFPFRFLVETADRDTLYAFKRGRRRVERFWVFYPFSRARYDEYVCTIGPWDLPGVITLDASTGLYVDETDDARNGVAGGIAVHPAAGVNDEFVCLLPRPSDKVTITIATPASSAGGAAAVTAWQYSKNDRTWAIVPVLVDGTNSFKAAAGDHDVTLTIPTDWDTIAVNGAEGYGLKAVFDSGTVPTPPTASRVICNSKVIDLPVLSPASSVTVYDNGTALAAGGTDYTLTTAGGGGGSDRITLTAYRTQGHLITADFTGKVRIRGFFSSDPWKEKPMSGSLHSFSLNIMEDAR